MESNYDSVRVLEGIGEKKAGILFNAGITNLREFAETLPVSYEIIRNIKTDVCECSLCDRELLKVKIKSVSMPYRARKNLNITKVRFMDETQIIHGVFFNKPYIRSSLKIDEEYLIYGKISKKNSYYQIINPQYCLADSNSYLKTGIFPIYKSLKGFSNKEWVKCISSALKRIEFTDCIPNDIKEKYGLVSLSEAYNFIHLPCKMQDIISGEKRLNFDNFVGFHLCKLNNKFMLKSDDAPKFTIKDKETFLNSLEFNLTAGQLKAFRDIEEDMTSSNQMRRLMQGDVGCGKTVVALYALYECAKNGFQGVLLAPTQILAKQHYEKISSFLISFGIKTVLLTSVQNLKEKNEIKEKIQTGEADIIIGTHSVFSEDIKYKSLGLVVIDEQHRFGVKHRADVEQKGKYPNVLVMSATPIPRTLALALYGELDLTVIEDKPLNRKKVKTYFRNYKYEKRIYDFIAKEIDNGRQAYVVCPSISSEDYAAAEEVYDEICTKYLPKYKSALIHGRLKENDKDEIMEAFQNNKINVIVSTSIVEVGIDVPNATVMLIHDAHRFGLSQLHQLRGRVGRGDDESYCILLSDTNNKNALDRLNVLVKNDDGFLLAKYDLETRGSGDLTGFRQSGIGNFDYYKIMQNDDLFLLAENAAEEIICNKENSSYADYCLSKYENQLKGVSFS